MLIRNTLSTNATRHGGATAGRRGTGRLRCPAVRALAHRAYRDPIAGLTLSVIATAFAAVAGLLAVPGASGCPQRAAGRDGGGRHVGAGDARNGLWCSHIDCGVVLRDRHRRRRTGAVSSPRPRCTSSVRYPRWCPSACSEIAARMSIVLAGLSPQLADGRPVWHKAIRADDWLTSLLAAFSSSAAVGAIVTALAAAGAPGPLHRVCRRHRRAAAAACTVTDARRRRSCSSSVESSLPEQHSRSPRPARRITDHG